MGAIRFTKTKDGKIVSSLYVYTVDLPSRHLGVIEEVFTDEGHRGRGYATELIKEAIAFCKAHGCTCVELTVREDRPEIQAFYQNLGFFDRKNRAYRLVLKG